MLRRWTLLQSGDGRGLYSGRCGPRATVAKTLKSVTDGCPAGSGVETVNRRVSWLRRTFVEGTESHLTVGLTKSVSL